MIDLRLERTRAGLSQAELGARLGIFQAQVQRYEQDPESVPIKIIEKWLTACGTDFSAALERSIVETESPGLETGDPYVEFRARAKALLQKVPKAGPLSGVEPDLRTSLGQLRGDLTILLDPKPYVTTIGAFDSGKSTLLNTLLGGKYLPEDYAPTTRIVAYIRHEEDRPPQLQHQVILLRPDFNPLLYSDAEHIQSHKVPNREGDLKLLSEFGVFGQEDGDEKCHVALIYLRSPVLRSCTLIDTPGFDDVPRQEDDESSLARERAYLNAIKVTDILLFLSPTAGFLKGSEVQRLTSVLSTMHTIDESGSPDFERLYIVSSHASPTFDKDDRLNKIWNQAAHRLYDYWKSKLLPRTADITSERDPAHLTVIKARLFTFFRESVERRYRLESALRNVLEVYMPTRSAELAERRVAALRDEYVTRFEGLRRSYEERRSIGSSGVSRDEVLTLIATKRGDLLTNRGLLVEMVRAARDRVNDEVVNNISLQLTVDAIGTFIRQHFTRFADARADALFRLQSDIQEQVKAKLEKEVEALSAEAKSIEADAELYGLRAFVSDETAPVDIGRFSVASGAGALGVLSALFYVGLMDPTGIVVLSTLILKVTIGAFAALASLLFYGEKWQTRLARKIADTLREKQFVARLSSWVSTYFDDVTKNLHGHIDKMIASLDEYEGQVKSSAERTFGLENSIRLAGEAVDYCNGLSWSGKTP